ncbi:ubiquinol-cytochrome c reductase iron-sulfur subunit [Methyloversatilis discipulorum]|uniref:QcrA and Rieske domain-containing protein n=1 Tax=Methyloversatilis discipulorum TaxID=1119528 RepID=UPI001A60D9FF|nr:Rieske (2Fe-2S) protein [Methyloversatilis discipulorum]MBL8468141.1 Rieske (2Fe-2S) protein [Methyloversatilis discipulorum]
MDKDNTKKVADSACAPCCMQRRDAMKAAIAVTVMLGSGLRSVQASEPTDLPPQPGDRLVRMDDEDTPQPLKVADIPLASKPVRALPFAATDALVRDGSRLGRVILMRFDPASLDDETRARSADGVLAYSAVCTHQGCEVSEWDANGGAMFCFCHFSKFDPLKAGAVTAGPAGRALPWLPLKSENGELVVAGAFSSVPGVRKG